MIKYIDKPEERLTVAILENTRYDAVNKIRKTTRNTDFYFDCDKYYLPNNFRVVLRCDPRDTYDKEEGHRRAKKILLDNYHKSLNKRIDVFRDDLIALNSFFEKNIGFKA